MQNVFGGIKNLFQSNEKDEKEKEEKQYMKFNYDLHKTDQEGRNVIHRTCFNLKRDIVQNLLLQMKDSNLINSLDIYGNSPLILASKKFVPLNKKHAIRSRKAIMQALCEKGANVDILQVQNRWSAFHWLCYNGDYESLKMLYFRNPLYYTPDKEGNFAIDIAGLKVSITLFQ